MQFDLGYKSKKGGKMKLILITLVFMLSACAVKSPLFETYTAKWIKKGSVLFYNRMESTPIVWQGKIIHVVSNRQDGNQVEFYDGSTLIAVLLNGPHLLSAIVINNEVYVFGTNDNKTIYQVHSSDLITWSAPITVISEVPGRELYNSSVTTYPNGYIIAYETCEPNTKCFSARFAVSTDLINWTHVGDIFKPKIYAACPMIRYHNGYFYVFYLEFRGHFYTAVSRSRDLIHWDDSGATVLSSLDGHNEGENNSDMDMVEFNGQVYINYAIGNQLSTKEPWMDIRQAVYNGNQESFLQRFYP